MHDARLLLTLRVKLTYITCAGRAISQACLGAHRQTGENMKSKSASIAAAFATMGIWGGSAQAVQPIVVTQTVTGSAGDWVYDFSVTNNLGGTNDVYFFGVQLDAPDISGAPAGFDPNVWPSWNNASYGGSSTAYNNNWIDLSFASLQPGQTVGGFEVTETTAAPQSNVAWFAYANGGTWTGGGNFNSASNPGFEGGVGSAAPEPSTWAMMGLGFAALALLQSSGAGRTKAPQWFGAPFRPLRVRSAG